MIGALTSGYRALVVERMLERGLEPYLRAAVPEDRADLLLYQQEVRHSAALFRRVRDAADGSEVARFGAGGGPSVPAEVGVSEAAALLGLEPRQVRNLAQRWKADGLARKVSRAWLIDLAAVEHYRDRERDR